MSEESTKPCRLRIKLELIRIVRVHITVFVALLAVSIPIFGQSDAVEESSSATGGAEASELASESENAPSLNHLIDRITSVHPRVRAQAQRLASELEGEEYASSRYPDPRLGIFWLNSPYKRELRYVGDETPMSGVEVRLSQPIPFPGRLSSTASLHRIAAERERLKLALERNRIVHDFLRDLNEWILLREELALTEHYETRAQVIAQAARARYSVGRGNLSGVTRANVEKERYSERRERLRGQMNARLRNLRYFVLDEDDEMVSLPTEAELDQLVTRIQNELPEREPDTDAVGSASLLAALAHLEESTASAQADVARYDYLPDLELYAAYRFRKDIENDPAMGEDFVSFGLTMRVPLWSALSNHNQIDARHEAGRAARFANRDILLREQAEYSSALLRYQSQTERLRMYESALLSQAREGRDAIRTAYQTGQAEITDLLSAWSQLYMLESEALRLEADRRNEILKMGYIWNVILPDERSTARPEESL